MARPSLATPEIVDAICERLSQGYSLVEICNDPEMPGLRTVMRWAADDPVFGTEYGRAREAQAEVMDHKILSAAEQAKNDNAAAVRVQVDAYKWRAAKLAPKRYGERTTIAGDPEAPLVPEGSDSVAALAAILAAAEARRDKDGSDLA